MTEVLDPWRPVGNRLLEGGPSAKQKQQGRDNPRVGCKRVDPLVEHIRTDERSIEIDAERQRHH